MEEINYYNAKPAKSKLGVASTVCYVVGIIAILVSAFSFVTLFTRDYTKNKPYMLSYSILGMPIEFSVTLKDGGIASVSTTALFETENYEVKYYVADGILYMESDDVDSVGFEKIGKINSTKISGEDPESDMSMTLVCKSAKIQQNISIAVISVGAAILLTAIILTAINKKNKPLI